MHNERRPRHAWKDGDDPMSFQLQGKVAWISGGSGDLGAAIATRFVSWGARVFVTGRSEERLRKTREVIESAGIGEVASACLDVTDSAAVTAVMPTILDRFGRLDVLVNSTSVSRFGDFLTLDESAWLQVYEAKLFAYVRTIRAVLPTMIGQRGGVIVNVSGNGAKLPQIPSHVPGSTANAAVNTLTKSVADLYAKEGIRANCVAPGPIRTRRYTELATANRDAAPDDTCFAYLRKTLGDPDDVAHAAGFLASDLSAHITGTVITVDGGATPTVE
jgi:NAD(P)-dependent dehydrogenase (short-subunit alcohol dehydrogenase family)